MTIFFTADQHYGHAGALRFRPQFETLGQMDDALIQAHNRRVSPQDTVYMLGDISFHGREETIAVLSRLNGSKVWVTGNHDEKMLKHSAVRERFTHVAPMLDMKFGDQRVTMCHYPMLTWNKSHYGAWMLHGHSHGNCRYPFPAKILDVGVDTNNGAPYSFNEIEDLMPDKAFTAVDHHTEKDRSQQT
jgi:calcineurin-like phosphoesterase family protein